MANPTAESLQWWQLQAGDRVRHFEYGAGTVDGSGPVWVCITWDNPAEELTFHTSAIVPHLRLEPPSAGGGGEPDSRQVV
ncbi:hypothetical protein AB0E69_33090 [Kribbella sp. NPDC026611]|uniref:hypothetical protein n=1 Tax=Kribbella sp. NPDC026611 TaxID=3154911 RepID=UPI0033E682C4